MKKQRTSMLIYGGCVLGILAAAFAVLLPLVRQLRSSAHRLDTARKEQVEILETTRATSLQKRTIDSLKAKGADFSAFRVSEATIVEFLDSLDALSTKNGVNLIIENLPPPSAAKQSMIPFSLQGTLPGIFGFLKDLEAQPTYLSITQITFTPLEAHVSHPTLAATLSATLTWQ